MSARRASTASWKGPAQGYRFHDPALVLCLEVEFARTPAFGRLRPWRIFEGLASLLGDHPVTLRSWASSAALFGSGLDWRSSGHATALRKPISWMAQSAGWD